MRLLTRGQDHLHRSQGSRTYLRVWVLTPWGVPSCVDCGAGARIQPCGGREGLISAAELALSNRKIGAHNLNSRSNRSHLMLTLFLDSKVRYAGAGPTTYGSITFVDLAGSERLKVRRSALVPGPGRGHGRRRRMMMNGGS